jgi:hypothetical protein
MDKFKPGDKVRLLSDQTPATLWQSKDNKTIVVPKGAIGTVTISTGVLVDVQFPEHQYIPHDGRNYWTLFIEELELVTEG